MKRLTVDNVEEMGMFSLAHNCCYIDKNRNTRYRDFEIDIDARELAKGLLRELTEDAVSFASDEDFDDWMGTCIGEDGLGTLRGLIATFYQNILAMARLRERLKWYENMEERARKTLKDDFFEKLPYADRACDGIPTVCAAKLGYLPECPHPHCEDHCGECWNQPLEEE